MKKFISVLLTITLFFGSLCLSCFATDLPIIDISAIKVGNISIDNDCYSSGRKVRINVKISGSSKVESATVSIANGSTLRTLTLTYNPSGEVYVATFATDSNTMLGTWQVTKVTVNGTDYGVTSGKAFTLVMPGDVNFDGEINGSDVFTVFKANMGLKNLNKMEQCAADVNRSGSVTSLDWLILLLYNWGIVENF